MAFPATGIDVFSNASRSPPSTPERVRTSVHGDIVYPPLSDTTREVFKSIVKGRKSWKTLRGNGEAVWPPELEAALLEGLESYQPDDSRETRLLGRFPMRNRYISDYIFRVTGKRRTAKQVGSRLQQLRDTCGGKKLLALLSPCRRDIGPHRSTPALMREQQRGVDRPGLPHLDLSSLSDTSSTYSPTTPLDSDPNTPYFETPAPPRSVICIDILPEDAPPPPPSPSSSSSCTHSPATSTPPSPSSSPKRDSITSTDSSNDVSYVSYGDNVFHPSQPRPLKSIDPTVTFVASTTITAESFFTVLSDNVAVYSETTTLMLVSPQPSCETSEQPTSLLYSTSLVPGYWKTIAESADPTRFTIQQEVVRDPHTMSSTVMFSAVYKFSYPPDYITTPSSSSPTTTHPTHTHTLALLSPAPSPSTSPAVSPSAEQTEAFTELSLNDYFMPLDAVQFTDPFAHSGKQESYYELVAPSSVAGVGVGGNPYEFDGTHWGHVQPQHHHDNVAICPTSFTQEFSTYVL